MIIYHVYLLDDGVESYWVSAASESNAVEVQADHLGYLTVGEYRDIWGDVKVSQLPDEQELTVVDSDGQTEVRQVKTCGEWAVGGPGIIATTCL